jgi:dienelactone hydrolase
MNRTLSFFLALLSAVLLSASDAGAKVRTRTVAYEHGGTTMKGYLAWDDALKGPRPAVIVVHDYWGLNDYARERADQLAALGYTAFAVDLYGGGRVGAHPEDARAMMAEVRANVETWRGRANAALAALRKEAEADPARVAAIGYCFGGATVLQMLYSGADLKAAVSFHGALPPADSTQAISRKTKILILHGADDPHVPPESVAKFKAPLDAAKIPYTFVAYPGAVHSFTVKVAGDDPKKGSAYNAEADRKSWDEMTRLFRDVF